MQCKHLGAKTQQLFGNTNCLGQEEIDILFQLSFIGNFDKNAIFQAVLQAKPVRRCNTPSCMWTSLKSMIITHVQEFSLT